MYIEVNFSIIQWLKEDFVGYLDKWSKSVDVLPNISAKEKLKMKLSNQTMEGLRMTGKRNIKI